MHTAVRLIDTYSPILDMRRRHPGWAVQVISDLPEDIGEVYLPKRQLILLSRAMHDRDRDYAYAHLVAHLDLHPIGGPFNADQEYEARLVAEIRLDREGSRP